MSDLLIVKNVTREGPGLLADVLAEHNISFDLVDLDKGEPFPTLVGYKALVVLGGPDSANDTTDKMTNELARVGQALANGLPYLGICLGMQVLVKAAGGRVLPGAEPQAGFFDRAGKPFTVKITEDGKADPLLAGLQSPLRVFHLHGEVVELNADIKLLGTERVAPNQIVRVGTNAYGIQSHFELTEEMLAVWAAQDPDLQPIGYDTLQPQFNDIKREYTETGETLLHNFLKIAQLL